MHTDLPWHVFHLRAGHATGDGQFEIQGPDGLTLVAYIPTLRDNPRGFRKRKANAELIVKACNNHHALMRALKRCLVYDCKRDENPARIEALQVLKAAGWKGGNLLELEVETDEILEELKAEDKANEQRLPYLG